MTYTNEKFSFDYFNKIIKENKILILSKIDSIDKNLSILKGIFNKQNIEILKQEYKDQGLNTKQILENIMILFNKASRERNLYCIKHADKLTELQAQEIKEINHLIKISFKTIRQEAEKVKDLTVESTAIAKNLPLESTDIVENSTVESTDIIKNSIVKNKALPQEFDDANISNVVLTKQQITSGFLDPNAFSDYNELNNPVITEKMKLEELLFTQNIKLEEEYNKLTNEIEKENFITEIINTNILDILTNFYYDTHNNDLKNSKDNSTLINQITNNLDAIKKIFYNFTKEKIISMDIQSYQQILDIEDLLSIEHITIEQMINYSINYHDNLSNINKAQLAFLQRDITSVNNQYDICIKFIYLLEEAFLLILNNQISLNLLKKIDNFTNISLDYLGIKDLFFINYIISDLIIKMNDDPSIQKQKYSDCLSNLESIKTKCRSFIEYYKTNNPDNKEILKYEEANNFSDLLIIFENSRLINPNIYDKVKEKINIFSCLQSAWVISTINESNLMQKIESKPLEPLEQKTLELEPLEQKTLELEPLEPLEQKTLEPKPLEPLEPKPLEPLEPKPLEPLEPLEPKPLKTTTLETSDTKKNKRNENKSL